MWLRKALILFLLLSGAAVAGTREYPMLHYTQENGLPGDCIYKIFQDTDNGKGLNVAKTRKAPGHESTALGNIHKRLEQLSLIHGKNYRLEITELSAGDNKISGTRARISIEL